MRTFLSLVLGFLMWGSVEAALPFTPYLGVEGAYRAMNFKEKYGRSEFKHNIHGVNGFLGAKLDKFAVEVGGHITPWVGTELREHKLHGLFASVLGFIPVTESVELLGGVGVSHVTFTFVRPEGILGDNPPKYMDTSDDVKDALKIARTSFSNFTPRVVAGVQCKLVDNIHTRFSGSFEGTRKMKHYEIRPKNSSLVHAGLVLSF